MQTTVKSRQHFNNARLRSFFKSIYHKLKKEDDCLPSLQEIKDITKVKNEYYLGVMTIPVDNIIGSEGRYEDFNRDFFPKKDALQSRWSRIDTIMEENKPLPPISVFKIDDYYFVRDGNHRVSVAKSRKQAFIDAKVTAYEIDISITKELTVKDRIMIQEHSNFLEITGLNSLGRGCDIKLTRSRSYRLLLNIIQHFTEPFEDSAKKKLTLKEVATEWYCRVFLPFAEGAYLDDLLANFPNRTTGDLYVWIQMNWDNVKDNLGERLNYLAKPANREENETVLLDDGLSLPQLPRDLDNQYLRANIGLAVTCTIFNITRQGEISIAIVKRKYHPFEDYWSLPIAIINEKETRYDGANRCIEHSLGIKKIIKLVHYETFDSVDRTPFGRIMAFGMIGIHYGENIRMTAGGIASEIKLIPLHEVVELVYDHNQILKDAYRYIYRIRNNFSFIKRLFPGDIPIKYVRQIIREIRTIQHEDEQRRGKPSLFGKFHPTQ